MPKSDLTDEERTKAIFPEGEENSDEGQDDPSEQEERDEESSEEDEEDEARSGSEEDSEEEEKPAGEESEDTQSSQFTLKKPYDWLKGDSPDDWVQSLIEAHKQSSTEGVRLSEEVKQLKAQMATQNKGPEKPKKDEQPVTPFQPVAPTAPPAQDPSLAYAQGMMQKDMTDSFNSFAEKYPEARAPGSKEKIESVGDGVRDAFIAREGRIPTYTELYEQIGQFLGFKAVKASSSAKDAAAKAAGSSSKVNSGRKPPMGREPTDEQVEVARWMFPGKSDAAIRKELAAHV